jgi:pyruvate dehydrogenase E2 component (dihydrolipoamide acetyltransferase)
MFALRRVTTNARFLRSRSVSRRFFATEYPPHEILPLPALSPTMEIGGVANWIKKEGDAIMAGDIVVEIETDKATVDFEAQDDAFVAKILVDGGTSDLPVGTPIAVLVDEESDVAAFANYVAETASSSSSSSSPLEEEVVAKPLNSPASTTSTTTTSTPTPAHTGRVPSIKFRHGDRAAIQAALGLTPSSSNTSSSSTATSNSSTILDEMPVDPRGHEDIPLSAMRKIIASRLTESKATIPHYYTRMECNIDNMLSFRKELKNVGVNVSVNDLVIVAAALSLRDVPEANSFWNGDRIEQNETVDISVAVATEGGLITPIVKQADCIGLSVSYNIIYLIFIFFCYSILIYW